MSGKKIIDGLREAIEAERQKPQLAEAQAEGYSPPERRTSTGHILYLAVSNA